MNTRYALFFSILIVALSFSSCFDDTQAKLDLLEGKWEMESATRAGKPMGLFLKGTYFHFKDGKQLECNLPYGPDVTTPYTVPFSIVENQITSPDLGELVFVIDELEENSLKLSCNLNNAPWTIVLRK